MPDFRTQVREAFKATRHPLDEDIVEELSQHAEATFEALRADGVLPDEAEARVQRMLRDWCADPAALNRRPRRATAVVPPASSRGFAAGALADVAYAWRLLRSRPGHGVVTILTIALGVSAVTTLFSVANGVLLRPLSWATGEGLVRVSETRGGREGRVPGTLMNGTFLSWADAPQTIQESRRGTPVR
jgi:hypothetical protein